MPKVPKNLLKLLGRTRGAAVSKWLKQAQKSPPLEMRRWGVLEKQPFQSTREAVFKPKDRWTREKRMMDLKRKEVQGVISENRKKQTSTVLERVEKFLAESEGSSDERVLKARERILAGFKAAGQPYEDMRIKDAKHKVQDAKWEPPPVKKSFRQKRTKGEWGPEMDDRRSMDATIREGKWNRKPGDAAKRVASIVKIQEDKYGLLLRAADKKRAGQSLTDEEAEIYKSSKSRGFESRMRRRGNIETQVRSGALADVRKRVGDYTESAVEELTRIGPEGVAEANKLAKHSPEIMKSFAGRIRDNAGKNAKKGPSVISEQLDKKGDRLWEGRMEGKPDKVVPMERNASVLALDLAKKAEARADNDPAGAYLLNRAARALSQADKLPPAMVEKLTQQAENYLKTGKRWPHGSKRMEPEQAPHNVESDTLKPGQSYLGVGEKGRELPNAGLQKTRSERLKEKAFKEGESKDKPPAPSKGQIAFGFMRKTPISLRQAHQSDMKTPEGHTTRPSRSLLIRPTNGNGRLRHSEVDMMGKDAAWTQPGSAQGQVPDVPGQLMFPKGRDSVIRMEVEGSRPPDKALHDDDFFSVLTKEQKGEKPGLRDEADLRAAMAKNRENEKALTGGYERKKLGPADDDASTLAEIMNRAQGLKHKAASMGNPLPGSWEGKRQLQIMQKAEGEAKKGQAFFQKILDRSKLGGKPHEMSDEDRKRMYELSATLRRFL